MARIAQTIDPQSAVRLKQLCNDAGISQSKLSELSGVTQNTISKIMTGKSPLTHNVALQIVDAFPMYRAEWLEGVDDEPTVTGNQFIRSAIKATQSNRVLHNAFLASAMLCGYTIAPQKGDVSASNYVLRDATLGYTVTKGRQTISVTDDEMIAFEHEILDFIDLKIRHLLMQKEKGNG